MFNKKFIMFITMITCIIGLMITPSCAVYTNSHNDMINPTNNHTNQINKDHFYIPFQEAYCIAANHSKYSPYGDVSVNYTGRNVIYGVPVYEFKYMHNSKEVGYCDVCARNGAVFDIQWICKSDKN